MLGRQRVTLAELRQCSPGKLFLIILTLTKTLQLPACTDRFGAKAHGAFDFYESCMVQSEVERHTAGNDNNQTDLSVICEIIFAFSRLIHCLLLLMSVPPCLLDIYANYSVQYQSVP